MGSALTLARALANPASVTVRDATQWTGLITAARAEQLIGTLAHRLDGLAMPNAIRAILADARGAALSVRRTALWEAEMARRALSGIDAPIILLKGTAYAAAGLMAGQGRSIGDLDILVPHSSLPTVEGALLSSGWEEIKSDPYDDAYYRRWMHELPPLIHRERDRIVDVHHTILPPTARPKPDPGALISDAMPLTNGLFVLGENDMIVHAAAHLFADGDLTGGLRNLWDIHCLIEEFGTDGLGARAAHHKLAGTVRRAARQAHALFGTTIPEPWESRDGADALFQRRLLARDDWGRSTRPLTRFGFYVRSHWLRMPPKMLARHLWIKWRRQPSRSIAPTSSR